MVWLIIGLYFDAIIFIELLHTINRHYLTLIVECVMIIVLTKIPNQGEKKWINTLVLEVWQHSKWRSKFSTRSWLEMRRIGKLGPTKNSRYWRWKETWKKWKMKVMITKHGWSRRKNLQICEYKIIYCNMLRLIEESTLI